ncbi:hypothetical protein MNBD_NITROSPINAE04-955 [hydrothermal vent metagenome]|uniref:Type II secretion system protein GspN n=1 Tax=hydrothermal vent metagenome TaxID=652676 RepID=A0A3B1BHB7_9ZZZZ
MMARLLFLRNNIVSLEMRDVVKVIGYFAFFLVAMAFFTYIRFPSESLRPLVEKIVAGAPVKIEMSDISLMFPPGLKLNSVRISDPAAREGIEALSMETLTIKPSYLSIITGSIGGFATAKLLGGEVSIYATSDIGSDGSVDIKFNIDDVDPALLTLWENFKWAKLGGSLSGKGSISMKDGNILKSSGGFKADLSGGRLTLSKALVGDGAPITLDSGTVELALGSGKVKIKRAVLKGPEMEAKLSGDIMLSPTPQFSRLNLKAALKISGGLNKKIGPFLSFFKKDRDGAVSVKISGTLAAPVTR